MPLPFDGINVSRRFSSGLCQDSFPAAAAAAQMSHDGHPVDPAVVKAGGILAKSRRVSRQVSPAETAADVTHLSAIDYSW